MNIRKGTSGKHVCVQAQSDKKMQLIHLLCYACFIASNDGMLILPKGGGISVQPVMQTMELSKGASAKAPPLPSAADDENQHVIERMAHDLQSITMNDQGPKARLATELDNAELALATHSTSKVLQIEVNETRLHLCIMRKYRGCKELMKELCRPKVGTMASASVCEHFLSATSGNVTDGNKTDGEKTSNGVKVGPVFVPAPLVTGDDALVESAPAPAPVPGPDNVLAESAPASAPVPGPGGLPEQGFKGSLVRHVTDQTMTSDWQQERADGDYVTICKDHPNNVWCRSNGLHLRGGGQTHAIASTALFLLLMRGI